MEPLFHDDECNSDDERAFVAALCRRGLAWPQNFVAGGFRMDDGPLVFFIDVCEDGHVQRCLRIDYAGGRVLLGEDGRGGEGGPKLEASSPDVLALEPASPDELAAKAAEWIELTAGWSRSSGIPPR